MRSLILAAVAALSFASAANARICYDAHHHVARCRPAPQHIVHRCRDRHGHIIACHR